MSAFLYRTLTSRPIASLMNMLVGHYVTIYMIHRPRPLDGAYDGVSPELLEQCILYAKAAGFEFASVDEVIEKALAKQKPKHPTLCFTLDDGYQDQLDQLVPVLLKHQCKPTLFTIIDMVEGIDWPWDSRISDAIWNARQSQLNFHFNNQTFVLDFSTPEKKRISRRELTRFGKSLPANQLDQYVASLLNALDVDPHKPAPSNYKPSSWNSLRQAEKAGLRIGSHACSHRVFSALSDTQIKSELQRAHDLLAHELENPSRVFCYPSGRALSDFSEQHTELVKNTNFFIGAVTSMPGNISLRQIEQQPFLVNRHSFPASFEKFVRYSSWLEYIRSRI
ncbi:polysaccharide deacetylase family protein [Cellvibrio sp. pealriver]|uniref:polysaccharide deacetylase family protein n=1 Tax=Cellvibrio sp. pealriver TaxID=1622269 RepID=UPI00066FDC0A|nr:polysaccharide deacetylase family protein [Cellvibrio sp. pealriver]